MKILTLAAAFALVLAGSAPIRAAGGLDDAQILYVIHTLDEAEIIAGKEVLARSRNPDVKAMAENLVEDHGSIAVTSGDIATKLRLQRRPSPVSADLDRQGVQARQRRTGLDGGALDQAYVADEIAFHRSNEALLSGTLIPAARSGQVKGLLLSTADLERSHRLDAEQLAPRIRQAASP